MNAIEPPPIRFECPQGHRMRAAAQFAGRSGKCPHCGSPVIVPESKHLTETDIFRLVSEEPETTSEPDRPPVPVPRPKACPRCAGDLLRGVTICCHCRLRLGDARRELVQACIAAAGQAKAEAK